MVVPLTMPKGHALTDLSGITLPATLEVRLPNGKKLAAFTNSTLLTALAVGAALTAAAAVGAHGQHQPPAGQTHTPDHMDHRFDDPERYAKSFDDPARDAWQMPDKVIAALNLRPGQKVADVGAGTGYFSVRLARSATKPTVE